MMNQLPFEHLLPDFIMSALESQGYLPDGRITALNSYENRVYQVGIEEADPVIVKFYRPARWSNEQILEEHAFCEELRAVDLPVLVPLRNDSDEFLSEYEGMRFSVYPRMTGRAPEVGDETVLEVVGRWLARMHLVGEQRPFLARPKLDRFEMGQQSATLIAEHFIPMELKTAYETLVKDLLDRIETAFTNVGEVRHLRVHGDCHIGNMLWRDGELYFVDFDDARMAPAVQDLWMLLSGEREQRTSQLTTIIQAYREFNDFDLKEIQLIEPLRTLRMIYYSAWLARRWEDPAFKQAFTWFNTIRYWSDHILQLREQLAALDEPPLALDFSLR